MKFIYCCLYFVLPISFITSASYAGHDSQQPLVAVSTVEAGSSGRYRVLETSKIRMFETVDLRSVNLSYSRGLWTEEDTVRLFPKYAINIVDEDGVKIVLKDIRHSDEDMVKKIAIVLNEALSNARKSKSMLVVDTDPPIANENDLIKFEKGLPFMALVGEFAAE